MRVVGLDAGLFYLGKLPLIFLIYNSRLDVMKAEEFDGAGVAARNNIFLNKTGGGRIQNGIAEPVS